MSTLPPSQQLDDFPLDILGQQERINRLYTPITFCFPLPDQAESTRSEIVGTLQDGLARLARAFPWTAGGVARSESGEFKIRAGTAAPRLVVRDLSREDGEGAEGPSWDELQRAGFPFGMLDEEVVAPCRTMAEGDEGVGGGGGAVRPVLLVQANFIRGGGLLLTVCGQHGAMDVAGQAQVVALLAKGMRGEVFSRQEIEDGNATRRGHVPLPDSSSPSPSTSSTGPESDSAQEGSGGPEDDRRQQPPLAWAYLAFDKDSLRDRVKRAASRENTWRTFVSTDDALTAFLWQAISRAREPRLRRQQQPGEDEGGAGAGAGLTTTLTRNVDVRRHFGLPPAYPGLFVTSTSHTAPVGDLVHRRSLGSVALGLRAALSTEALRASLQDQAASITRDRGAAAAARQDRARRAHPGLDVRLSSWAKERLCAVDFGLFLGKPEAVRRPRFERGAREGLVFFMPRGMDGEIVVGVCLREEDMERLKGSARVASFARWIG